MSRAADFVARHAVSPRFRGGSLSSRLRTELRVQLMPAQGRALPLNCVGVACDPKLALRGYGYWVAVAHKADIGSWLSMACIKDFESSESSLDPSK